MKLVELLARELKVWPEGVVQLTQSVVDRELYDAGADGMEQDMLTPHAYLSDFHNEDEEYPLVTRADWEAEVARLAAETELAKVSPKKASAGGWIRHRGGKCPVEAGVLVDIRLRNGNVSRNRKPESLMWGDRVKCDSDIMAYRICEPEQASEPEQSTRERIKELHALAIAVGMGDSVENPLTWRDRIREIDITVEALEEERAGLVQQLEDEGFRLIDQASEVSEPVRDMNYWRNWQEGDHLEVIAKSCGHQFEVGKIVRLTRKPDKRGDFAKCEYLGGGNHWYLHESELKFHSRPSA